MKTKQIDLLRHGKPELSEVYLGQTDCQLSVDGRLEAAAAVSWSNQWDLIVTSPLLRCYETAQWYADQTGIELLVIPELQEFNFGDWDGQKFESVYSHSPEHADLFWSDPIHNPPPNGENIEQFQSRVQHVLKELIEHPCEHPLVITHGGVVRCLVATVLGVAVEHWSKIKIDYSHFTKLKFDYEKEQFWSQLVSCNTKQPFS